VDSCYIFYGGVALVVMRNWVGMKVLGTFLIVLVGATLTLVALSDPVAELVPEKSAVDFPDESFPKTVKVRLRNRGFSTLVVTDVKSSCNCAGATLEKYRVWPLTEVELNVTIDKPITQSVQVLIATNDPMHPKLIFEITRKRAIEISPRS